MPLDVLGRTRATLTHAASLPCPKGPGNLVNVCRDRDRLLQLLILNEEFLVNASHQLALITSLPFVHTARRTYRLNDSVNLRKDHYHTSSPLASAGGNIETTVWQQMGVLSPADLYIYGDLIVSQ
eukprot:gene34060-38498_t